MFLISNSFLSIFYNSLIHTEYHLIMYIPSERFLLFSLGCLWGLGASEEKNTSIMNEFNSAVKDKETNIHYTRRMMI